MVFFCFILPTLLADYHHNPLTATAAATTAAAAAASTHSRAYLRTHTPSLRGTSSSSSMTIARDHILHGPEPFILDPHSAVDSWLFGLPSRHLLSILLPGILFAGAGKPTQRRSGAFGTLVLYYSCFILLLFYINYLLRYSLVSSLHVMQS
jgi:hypothetical protein